MVIVKSKYPMLPIDALFGQLKGIAKVSKIDNIWIPSVEDLGGGHP